MRQDQLKRNRFGAVFFMLQKNKAPPRMSRSSALLKCAGDFAPATEP